MATSFIGANLRSTHLADATLDWVDLSGADLSGADVSEEQLARGHYELAQESLANPENGDR